MIRQNLVNDRVNLRPAKRRFLTNAEVFEFAKMNGANKTERSKLINYNKHFKDHHVFSNLLYTKLRAERQKVVRSTPVGVLRDLKLVLLQLYHNYSVNENNYGPGPEIDTDSDSETDTD